MGTVYLNGLCNIAATAAKNVNGGLFHEREGPIIHDLYVNAAWENEAKRTYRVHPDTFHQSQVLGGPLLYRGWVVQERFIALRILHFGKRQLYWECQKFDACESYPDGNPKFKQFKSNLKRDLPFKSNLNDGLDILAQTPRVPSTLLSRRLQFWYKVARAYLACNLTREEDKLVAISGLAKVFQASFAGTEYLAGIWRASLINDLCWNMEPPRRRPIQYRAPSWSWACVDGGQYLSASEDHGARNKVCYIQVLEASVDLRGSDPTCEVRGGRIRLQGYLMTLTTSSHAVCNSKLKVTINGVLGKAQVLPDVESSSQRLHCLPIRGRHMYMTCMLLEPTGSKKGQFQRYGMMYWFTNDHNIVPLEEDNIVPLEKVQNEEWLEFEEHVGKGQYIISII